MPKITIFIGLPGSGKTTYFKNQLSHLQNDVRYDDYHGSAIGNSIEFEKSRHYANLASALKIGKDCAMSDIAYCQKERLAKAIDGIKKMEKDLGVAVNIDCVYFKNDPNACRHNVVHRHRDNYMEELKNIDAMTWIYNPPADALPVITCCKDIAI